MLLGKSLREGLANWRRHEKWKSSRTNSAKAVRGWRSSLGLALRQMTEVEGLRGMMSEVEEREEGRSSSD